MTQIARSSENTFHDHGRNVRIAWFKETILVHEPCLRQYLKRFRLSDADIEDIVSESLLKAYSIENWARVDRGRGFLFTIARNMIVDAARHQQIVKIVSLEEFDVSDVCDQQPSPESIVAWQQELLRLQDSINRLPQRCRQVLLLKRVEQLSMRDIADRLSLSLSTVEKHLGKAMALLTPAKPCMHPDCVDASAAKRPARVH